MNNVMNDVTNEGLIDAYMHVFRTHEGQMVLENLIQTHYLRQSTYESPDDPPTLVAYREGGKNAVLRILALSGYTLAVQTE